MYDASNAIPQAPPSPDPPSRKEEKGTICNEKGQ